MSATTMVKVLLRNVTITTTMLRRPELLFLSSFLNIEIVLALPHLITIVIAFRIRLLFPCSRNVNCLCWFHSRL